MGGFPFLSNAYGSFGFTMPSKPVQIKRISNGTVFLTNNIKRDQFGSNRTGHTSNHPTFLSLFGPVWRQPSSYSRSGFRKEAVIGGQYKVGPKPATLYVDGEYLDHTYVDTGFVNADNNPYFYPGLLDSPNHANNEVENSRIRAVEKAYSDLTSSKASMGENLAQLNQTVDLFGTAVDASLDVLRAYRALRRGNLKGIFKLNAKNLKRLVGERKLEKRLANYWLAYWYGLHPLVNDAYGLYELMKEQAKPVLLVHGRGRSSLNWSDSIETKDSSSLACWFSISGSSTIKHQTHLTGRLDDARILRTINRAGLLNPLSLAWELIPFSFVMDWFVPVGQHLSNLTATSGLTFQGGSSTVTSERDLTVVPASSHTMGTGQIPASHYWGFNTTRTKLNSFPKGGLYHKPFFTGASRFATIAALISNLTRGL